MRQCCPLSQPFSNIVLKALAGPKRQEKAIKGIHIGKERVKLSLFTYDIAYVCIVYVYIYIWDSKTSTRKVLETINNFIRVAEY